MGILIDLTEHRILKMKKNPPIGVEQHVWNGFVDNYSTNLMETVQLKTKIIKNLLDIEKYKNML